MPIKINKGIVLRDITKIEYPIWRKGIHFIKSPYCRTIRINYAYTDKQFKHIDINIWKKMPKIDMPSKNEERFYEDCEPYEIKRKSDYL